MPQRIVPRNRKEILADSIGTNVFVMVARAMQTERNGASVFLNFDGGDVPKKFELAGKPLIQRALKAKIDNLQKKRNANKKKC